MRSVTIEDWKSIPGTVYNSKIIFEISDSAYAEIHYVALSRLYHLYRLGEWKNEIPNPNKFKTGDMLYGDETEYVVYHKNHIRLGNNIIECGHMHAAKTFAFFDYDILFPVFNALDKEVSVPYIPTYHANIYDRHDYISGKHEWKNYDPNLQDMYKALVDKNNPLV